MTFLFGNRKTQETRQRKPVQVARVGDNIELALWQADGKHGRRINWSFSRVSPENPEKTYRTFGPEDLLAMPAALATTALAFSRLPTLSAELREELATVGALLEQIEEQRGPALARELNGNGSGSPVLAF